MSNLIQSNNGVVRNFISEIPPKKISIIEQRSINVGRPKRNPATAMSPKTRASILQSLSSIITTQPPCVNKPIRETRAKKVEKKLSDAAMEGSVKMLNDLLQEDPLVLDRFIVSCCSETPLHIASMLGYLDLIKELLTHKPEFVSELDSYGSTLLHLATVKGHTEIMKELLWADSAACLVRNGDGKLIIDYIKVDSEIESKHNKRLNLTSLYEWFRSPKIY